MISRKPRTAARSSHRFAESPVLRLAMPVWRSRLIAVLLLGAMATLVGRAFYLQVVNNEFLREKGESRYLRDLEISALRGRVLDRNGDALAVSTPMKSVWAIPQDATLSPAQSQELARLLELDRHELARRLASDKGFVYLQRQIAPDVAAQIAAMKLPGVYQEREFRRFYPSGEAVAHLVGFTGVDDKGLEGVELAFQAQLAGRPGSRSVIKDRRGQIVEDVGSLKAPQDGRDIVLAMDSRLQYLAYSQLRQAVAKHRARAGGVVVLDAKTGEVLALANWPTYNPNNRQSLSGAQLRNRALTDTYEPGSTLKPFTAAMALETGTARANTRYDTGNGRLTIGSATISDTKPHGVLTLAEVIQKSSNVGTIKVAQALSAQSMWETYNALGFGRAIHLGFPGEVTGRLRPWKSWRPIEQATMSYGHGISVSLMQLARAYTVFASGGEILPLSLTRVDALPVAGERVFSPQTAAEVLSMLEMVTQAGGTATKAAVSGYRVAGKTGTARKLEGGQYTTKYVASFVGVAPVSDPRLVVAVMVDEPSVGGYYAGEVAAPLFAEITAGALRVLGVPADAPVVPRSVLAAVPGVVESM